MRTLQPFVVILVAVATLSFADVGLAALRKLDSPGVAVSEDYPEAEYQRLLSVLRSKKVKFLGGSTLNSFTSLRYQGDTEALSHFLDGLAKCRGLKIRVIFQTPRDAALSGADWVVDHDQNHVGVRVSLSSQRIDLEKLYIPCIRTPPLKSAGSEKRRWAGSE